MRGRRPRTGARCAIYSIAEQFAPGPPTQALKLSMMYEGAVLVDHMSCSPTPPPEKGELETVAVAVVPVPAAQEVSEGHSCSVSAAPDPPAVVATDARRRKGTLTAGFANGTCERTVSTPLTTLARRSTDAPPVDR